MKKIIAVLCAGLMLSSVAWANYGEEVVTNTTVDVNTIDGYGETTTYTASAFRDTTMSTDQFRATRGFDTVGDKRFQIETKFDYQVESDVAADRKQFSFPTQVRYGLVEDLELRVRGDMFTYRDTTGAADNKGFGDLTVGTKWSIVEGGGLLPSLGVIAELGVPTGNDSVSNNAVIPAGQAIMAWRLPYELKLDSNIGFDYADSTANSNGRFARFTYGAAVGRDLPLLGERLGAYLEFAGATALSNSGDAPHQFGTGIDYDITENMNVNTFGRVGLNDTAPNFQTGLGFAWRL